MAEWRRLADGGWDKALLAFPDASLSQSLAWARHKETLGQKSIRLGAYAGGKLVAMAQAFIRRYPLGLAALWVPGGPAGDAACWGEGLRAKLKEEAGVRRAFVRIRPYREDDPGLKNLGWRRARTSLDTGQTMVLPLQGGSLAESLTTNWRHNLKRAQARNATLRPWENPAAEDILAILKEVERYKNMPKQYSHDLSELKSLLAAFKDSLLVWRADDPQGRPIALRACVLFGGRGYDLLAGSLEEGRKLYSSYGVLWNLLEECRKKGASEFDMGGVDPWETGVFNFKKGLGGRLVTHLGEWEWADSPLLLWGANLMIRRTVKKR